MDQIAGIHPWMTMWSQPKTTIRALVHARPTYGVFYLAAVYALQGFFFYFNWWSLGLHTHYYTLLFLGVLLSPFIGFLWLYFMGFLFQITGYWLRGTAPSLHLRTAIAWSKIPYSIALLMWLILILINSDYVFIQDAGGPSSIFVNLITLILGIWSLILLIQGIREVQQFTIGRSIANVALAGFIFSVLSFLFFGLLRYIYITTF